MGKTKIVLNQQSDLILNNAQIVRPSGIVKSDLPGLIDDIHGLTMSIADEASARAAGDQQLSNDLSDLQNYVDTTVDSAIATLTSDLADETAARIADVNTEETRALAAEAQLSSDLSDLQTYVDTTVDSAITTLTSDLADETAARIADVDAEETRAIAAEVVLQSNIDTEKFRIDAILIGASASADNFAEIVSLINSVDTTNDQVFAGYVLSNDAALAAEISRATTKEDYLEAALSGEINGRVAGDAALSATFSAAIATETAARIADVDAEEARAIAAEGVLQSNLDTEATARISAVSAEETARIAGDAQLTSDLADLQTYVDTTVDSAISTLTSDLADETAARIADVDAEETRALAAEAALSSDLADLQTYVDTTVDSAISTLTSDLADETAARIADVDVEETRAIAAEGVLQSNIDVEKGRIDAILDGSSVNLDQFREVVDFVESIDLANDNSLLAAVTQINSDIDAEEAARIAADTQLTSDLGTETARAIAVEDDLYATKLNLSGGAMTGDIDMDGNQIDGAVIVSSRLDTDLWANNNKITDLASPTDAGDATNKTYVDDADAQLQSNIDAINTDISNSVNNESSARIAGDAQLQSDIDALALTDGDTIDVNYASNTIRLKEVVSAPGSGVRTFEGDIKVGQQPDTLPSYNNQSLITKGILDVRVSNEVSTINTSISDEVTRAQNAETQLQSNIDTEKNRIDAILLASDADKDSFAEIVQLINSVDTENDQAFASYVLSNNARLTAEEQERLRLTNLLGDGVVNEQIAREDGDAALQHEFDVLPMTDGETIELNYVDNTIRLKEFVNMPDSGVRVFEGDVKADSQPENRSTFNELSYVTKNYVDNKVTNDLSDAVAQEMAERIAADVALTELIDVKKSEAITISNEYTDVERLRAQSVEGTLQSSIDTLALTDGDTIDVNYASNTIRLKEVVSAPDSGVRTFEGDVKVGQQPSSLSSYNDLSLITKGIMNTRLSEEVSTLNTSISDEVSRAQNAETQLQSNIDTERNRIDAILLASDADKDSFAEIVSLINSVDTENDQAFASYVLSNNARLTVEEQERLRLTDLLGDGVVNEQIAREDGDAAIHNELNSLPMTDGETIDINYVDNTIKLKDIVSAPDSGYRVFEGDLKLNAQPETNSNFNDLSLITKYYVDNKVNTDLTNAIAQEEADRIAADAGLMADLSSEVSRAFAAEASLLAAIDAEVLARIAADSELDGRINDIVSNSNAPIIDSFTEVVDQLDELRSDLITETDSRATAEAALQAAIDAEASARIAADAGLDGRINDIISNTNAPIIDSFSEVVAQMESMPGVDDSSIVVDSENNVSLKETVAAPASGVRTFGGLVNVGSEPSLDENFVELSLVTKGYVTGLVDAEEAARIADVDAEETRAIAAEAVLQTNINTEANERMAEDITLQGNIDIEASRAQVAETAIATNLATEISDRIAAISAEETRAMLAEATLSATFSAAISTESTRAIAAEGVLQSNIDTEKSRIDSILLASDADKDSFAEIVSLINSVDTANDQVFAGYVLSNDAALAAEVSRATTTEAALSATFSAAISAEEVRALAAELVLTNDLSTEAARALAAESSLTSALSAEETSRIAGDATLQASLNNEIADRIAAGQSAQSALDSETARATAAEAVLTSALASEISRATAAEAALSATFSTALSAETFRATFAELTLSNDLSDETSYRIDADTLLQSNIDVEKGRIDAILIGASASADNFAEIVQLINSVDTTNDQAFASYVLSNNTALATEVSRAIADVDAEETRALAAEAALSADFANIYCKKVSVSGTPNGVLTSFALASPLRLGSEMIYLNGLLMEEGEDYTTVLTSGKVTSVTFSSAPTSVMKVVAYGVY